MKTIAFFNPKGGVGKTLHTKLFASYLAYGLGARVCVFDAEKDQRIIRQRGSDLRLMSDAGSYLARYLKSDPVGREPYDIRRLGEGVENYTADYLERLTSDVWSFRAREDSVYDYVLFDFPATFLEYSPAFALISSGVVDLVAVPVDTDADTRQEALIAVDLMRRNETKSVLFWNNVSADEVKRPGFLEFGEKIFRDNGFEFMPERVRSFVKARRDSDTLFFVKSTVCWPEKYIRLSCPYLIDFYVALKDRLDRV